MFLLDKFERMCYIVNEKRLKEVSYDHSGIKRKNNYSK